MCSKENTLPTTGFVQASGSRLITDTPRNLRFGFDVDLVKRYDDFLKLEQHIMRYNKPDIRSGVIIDLLDQILEDLSSYQVSLNPNTVLKVISYIRFIRNRGFDLVGIELNPGPKSKSSLVIREVVKPKNSQKKKSSKPQMGPENYSKKLMGSSVGLAKDVVLANKKMGPIGNMANQSKFDMLKYQEVLNDPFQGAPVRLGGETMIRTGLASFLGKYSFALNNSGNKSFVVYPRPWQPIFYADQNNGNYTYAPSSDLPEYQGLVGIASGARVIAAGIRVFTLSSATADNGSLTVGLLPRNTSPAQFYMQPGIGGTVTTTQQTVVGQGSGQLNPILPYACLKVGGASYSANIPGCFHGFNEFQNYESCEIYPLKDGATAVWCPEDPTSYTFKSSLLGASNVPIPVLTVNGPAINDGTFESVDMNEIAEPFWVIGVTGGSGNTAVEIELTLHLEYTVTSGYSSIIAPQVGSMSSVQSFHTAKSVFESTETRTKIGVKDGGLWESLKPGLSKGLRSLAGDASRTLFGSSDLGTGVMDLLGI